MNGTLFSRHGQKTTNFNLIEKEDDACIVQESSFLLHIVGDDCCNNPCS